MIHTTKSVNFSYKKFILFFVTSIIILIGCDKKPQLSYDFETESELDSLSWKCGTLFSLSGSHATSGTKSLKVEMYPAQGIMGDIYPGFNLKGFNKNWSFSSVLAFDIFNPQSELLKFNIRIDDKPENPPFIDRFNKGIEILPGKNTITIKLNELYTPGTERLLNLKRIENVILFMVDPPDKRTLYIDNIRLE